MTNDLLLTDDEAYYKQIAKEFKKTKTDVEEYINILRKWADTQPHFPEKPNYRTLRFAVLYNKFSIEKAKQKYDMYYTIRNLMPEYFKSSPFCDDMLFENKVWYLVPLPKVTDNFERIIYHKINPEYGDPKYFDHDKIITKFVQLVEYLIEEDLCYRFHYICDCAGWTLGHAANIKPMTLKKATIILEKVFSNRMASFYMVNFPSFLESLINTVLKPLLNPKLQKRFIINSGTDVLLKVFGKERMPKDIGGEEKSLQEINAILWQKYEEHKKMFLRLENLSVDESLRPAILKNDEVLGYYGNFKKIDLD